MKNDNVSRGWVALQNGRFKSSGGVFKDIQIMCEQDKRDFFEHEGLFFELNKPTGHLFAAFVQKTVRGAGHGGVRLWNYPTVEAFTREGLRLSLGMGRKNSLAGLWWGGGKGLIAKNDGVDYDNNTFRDQLFGEYGKFVSSLRGCYYGAEDVGLTEADTLRMFRQSRFITCIPKSVGGSGNPSHATARGTLAGMEGVLDWKKPGDTLKGKKIVVQGAGNVASFLIEELLKKGVEKIVASDITQSVLDAGKKRFNDKRVELVLTKPGDNSILFEPCDILAPCALGGVLNDQTIPKLQTKIVCGAANNQLLDGPRDDKLLVDRGISYIPDFLNNRMGIVNCANEMYGYPDNDPAINRHFGREWKHSVFNTTVEVLNDAKSKGTGTDQSAKSIADRLANEPHPIWGHRSAQIINSIIQSEWVQNK
jgi:leucine dehydrogenase